ncbi:type III pantothenate kinase [Marinifilum sp. RC60d5]|uniref:type III pantothenate kinase n=1 Tax=Marinifilum sp. RC60d5 TaxID=3458414 RepID=UPI0040370771
MNLILDIGNTKIKAAIVSNEKILQIESSEKSELEFASELIKKYNAIQNIIISSVRETPIALMQYFNLKHIKIFFCDSNLPIPLENLYETKDTLGYDRLAACIGAYAKYPKQNILIIDAGTAITFDFVNEKAQYCGGSISPGISMRYKALHHFTSKLPHLSIKENFNIIGRNTKDAIIGGVQNGIIFEIDSYIENLQISNPNLKVILTGGDAPFLHKYIRNKAFLDEHILLFGLNTILEFNLLDKPNN